MRLRLELWSSKDVMGAGGSISKDVPSHGWQPGAGFGWGSQFLSTWASQQGCLNDFTVWQLASHREGDPREQGGSCDVFYNSTLELTLCHFHLFYWSPRSVLIGHGKLPHSYHFLLPHLDLFFSWI